MIQSKYWICTTCDMKFTNPLNVDFVEHLKDCPNAKFSAITEGDNNE